ncbi:enoyl-CoA hydratase/isomerase family protein [Oceanibacterium hippocampi]|uniref:Putative enoyl-CoA hydratase n=1 Tax=Oceanibacterium hippocampi TaxID=745714 RepID=A0A1Y5SGD0_9PROT|nr:enoyl-CoA hydratase/isomerase family protein [Oceanibacterium hippocampi]SLN39498.1 putative enoyl-CoA hydratase [Oceanibacterium hippocampi]
MTQLEIAVDGGIALVTFASLPGGFMNDDTAAELNGYLDRAEGDGAIRATIFTGGEPGVFIRHFDVATLEARGRAMAARGLRFDPARPVPESPYLAALRRIEESPRPFVAAINGVAMGGGFELALACDIRLARTGDYPLGLPEINIGLLPGAGGTQRLTRLIGEAKALELLLQGRTFGPEEARGLGLVSECVAGDVVGRAREIAGRLAGQHPKALAHIKRLVRGVQGRPAADGLADERTLFCDLMVDADSIALMADFNAGKRGIRD